MSTVTLSVPGISCEHCEMTVTRALTGQEGVQAVAVDIPAKLVKLTFDPARITIEKVSEVLAEEDYPVASVA
jgi:copper chaperone CopZ